MILYCIENDGFCINSDGFCIQNGDFNANIKGSAFGLYYDDSPAMFSDTAGKNDGFCIKMMDTAVSRASALDLGSADPLKYLWPMNVLPLLDDWRACLAAGPARLALTVLVPAPANICVSFLQEIDLFLMLAGAGRREITLASTVRSVLNGRILQVSPFT